MSLPHAMLANMPYYISNGLLPTSIVNVIPSRLKVYTQIDSINIYSEQVQGFIELISFPVRIGNGKQRIRLQGGQNLAEDEKRRLKDLFTVQTIKH